MEFEDVLTTERQAIGTEEVAKAQQLLEKYKAGKAALDQRIIENEQWFRMQHWRSYKNNMMEGKPKPASGWLFNSIANKHADAMDNYPEPNILPRAADDEETAKVLSKIFPVLLEQADYEEVYSDTWWRKLKQGTGVKGVFWDPALRGGVGDIAIKSMDLLMLYWEPGVTDIQDSPNLFSLALANNDQLAAQWPQLEGHTGGSLTTSKYIHDESIDTSDKSVVVDWYYKKAVGEGRTVLHYCKFCNGVVLYASENDPEYAERGFYDHGKYPFVFDPLFVEEDSPAGFGYIDVMKDTATSIDEMNAAMDENIKIAAKTRYLVSDTAGVNEEELADLSKDIVHTVGRVNEESFKPLQTPVLSGNCISYRDARVAELKEIVELAGKPFIVKGIMTVKGALKAKEAGAAAIVVSNHGGRVLDQCPATAEVLPEIAEALKGSGVKILVDGGIRSGVDVFKALALGADAVLIARPFVTAVYGGGEEGVKCYIDKIAGELADTMQMCGAHSLCEITRDMVRVEIKR